MKSEGTHALEKRILRKRINGVVLAKFMNEESTMVTTLPPFGYNGFSIDERTDSDKAQDIIVPLSSIVYQNEYDVFLEMHMFQF